MVEEEEEEEDLEFLFPQLWSQPIKATSKHDELFMSSFFMYTLFSKVTECVRFLVRMSCLINTFGHGRDLHHV